MLNLFLAILLGNFDRARGQGEKMKIFMAFNSLINVIGYELNIAIGILFDDVDFTRYIEDRILGVNKKKNEDDEEDEELMKLREHTKEEMEVVYCAMCIGTIE